jgi:hypothetical protein
MASELRVNTLKDASGNNSVATSVVHSGSAKAWFHFNGTGTAANRGSYNISSLTDNGTGNFTENFSNNMNDANYATTGLAGGASSASAWADSITHSYVDSPCLTSSVSIMTSYNTSLADSERSAGQVDGDLA